MSEYKTKIMLGAVLAVIIAVGLAGATLLVSPQNTTSQQSSTSTSLSSQEITASQSIISTTQPIQASSTAGSPQSALVVQLSDPPIVPFGTTSLNLTYSAINLLVTLPSATTSSTTSSSSAGSTSITTKTTTSSPVTAENITLTPTGGSATVDLLKLQNISQTVASANLPNGSMIYSVSFTVSSISIDVNGVVSPVTLATGGNTLVIALTTPAEVRGTTAVLLDLNPTIVSTTTGYEMIPSSVGTILPQSETPPQCMQIGYQHQLTNQDHMQINQLFGKLSSKLVGLSVSGSTSTITVQISNIGNYSAQIVSIGVSGNFTTQGCTTSTTTTTTSAHGHPAPPPRSCTNEDQIVFVPSSASSSSTTTTSTSTGACSTSQMTLQNSPNAWSVKNELTLAAGQCVTLTFSGTISIGPSGNVLVPSTATGQTYTVQVITSNIPSPNQCVQPFLQQSCQGTPSNGQGNNNGQH